MYVHTGVQSLWKLLVSQDKHFIEQLIVQTILKLRRVYTVYMYVCIIIHHRLYYYYAKVSGRDFSHFAIFGRVSTIA